MSETETLSPEEKAYFDTRGETVEAPKAETEDKPDPIEDDEQEPVVDAADDEPTVEEADEPADPDADPDADKPTGQSKVPLAALTKERNERKAAAKRAADAEREAAILRDRWEQLLAKDQPAQTEQQAAPEEAFDPNKDPLAIVNKLWETEQNRAKTAAEQAKQVEEQRKANEVWEQTVNVARTQYSSAAAADETFEPTYTALRQNIAQEYMELYGLPEHEARQQVDQYEAQQIQYAVSKGIDIADHMRKLAKTRNIRVDKPKPAPTGEDIDKIAAGVSGSTSLSAAGGGRVAATTAQSIADMSADEFEAWLGKAGNADKFRKLAGG